MTHLQELYDAVKDGQSRPKLEDAADLAFGHGPLSGTIGQAAHGNTQAAIDFMQTVLPGERFSLFGPAKDGQYGAHLGDADTEFADTPARALLLAALAAMIAKGEG